MYNGYNKKKNENTWVTTDILRNEEAALLSFIDSRFVSKEFMLLYNEHLLKVVKEYVDTKLSENSVI